MKNNWLKISWIYVGTIIGAGFASGSEIFLFFGVYGCKGIIGITISGILFSLLGSLLLLKIYNNKIVGFDDLISRIFNRNLKAIIDIIMIISLYTGFSVMVAGSGAIFKEELGLSYNYGMLVMITLSFMVFLFDLKGLSFINSLLVPLLILGILFTSFYLNIKGEYDFFRINGLIPTPEISYFTSSLLYVGSNSLIIIIVFSSLLPLINNKKTAIYGGLIGGVVLYILGLSILTVMLIYFHEIVFMDVPMLKISSYIGNNYRKFYAIILWSAVFTTAVANGAGFLNKFASNKYKIIIAILFCLSSIPLAKLGFSNLVALIYPIFGFVGLFILIFILVVL